MMKTSTNGQSPSEGRTRQKRELDVSSPFWDTVEAAAHLHVSPRTLEKLRIQGGGPRYRKLGRKVLYEIEEVKRWWATARQYRSTSDPGELE